MIECPRLILSVYLELLRTLDTLEDYDEGPEVRGVLVAMLLEALRANHALVDKLDEFDKWFDSIRPLARTHVENIYQAALERRS